MSNQNSFFDSIDIAKFIGSILIFSMHCNAFGFDKNASLVLEILARWGVPFFFICSAYFLYSKSVDGNISKDVIIKYICRIRNLYIAWFVFNLPNVIYLRLYPKDITEISTWLIFLKDSILSSTYTGSWFLVSCIFSAWIMFQLSKKFTTKEIVCISFLFYILCVISSAYAHLPPPPLLRTFLRSFVSRGISFMVFSIFH